MTRTHFSSFLVVLSSLAGCSTDSPPANSPQTKSLTSVTPANDDGAVQPGLYSSGDDYERIATLISNSNAQVRLDVHSGIGWNGEQVGSIDELASRMKSVVNKNVVVISNGKAMWDMEDGYINRVVEFAEDLGYKQTIVIDDHSSGISLRKAMIH